MVGDRSFCPVLLRRGHGRQRKGKGHRVVVLTAQKHLSSSASCFALDAVHSHVCLKLALQTFVNTALHALIMVLRCKTRVMLILLIVLGILRTLSCPRPCMHAQRLVHLCRRPGARHESGMQ